MDNEKKHENHEHGHRHGGACCHSSSAPCCSGKNWVMIVVKILVAAAVLLLVFAAGLAARRDSAGSWCGREGMDKNFRDNECRRGQMMSGKLQEKRLDNVAEPAVSATNQATPPVDANKADINQ